MKRPLPLTVIGTFWFLLGVLEVCANTVRAHALQFPDASWFNIVAGVGLLSGWHICRWYALLGAGGMFIFTALFSLWAVPNADRLVLNFPMVLSVDDRAHGALSVLVVVAVLLLSLALSGWMFMALLRDDVRAVFQPRKVRHAA